MLSEYLLWVANYLGVSVIGLLLIAILIVLIIKK